MSTSAPSLAFRRCCCQLTSSVTKSQTRSFSFGALSYSSSRTKQQKTSPSQRRHASTDVAAATPSNPKISGIVDQISQLTLLETADLVASLKSRLNIPDISFAAPSSAPAAAAPAAEVEEEAPAAPAEKTMFTLKLESFETGSKPKIIKEVKGMLGLSLVDSKKFVESAPKVLKENVPKEEAEKIKKTIEALGAKVSMD